MLKPADNSDCHGGGDAGGSGAVPDGLGATLRFRERLVEATSRLRVDLLTFLTGVKVEFIMPVPDDAKDVRQGEWDCPARRAAAAPRAPASNGAGCDDCVRRWWRLRPELRCWKRAFTGCCGVTTFLADLSDGKVVLARWMLRARLDSGGGAKERSSPGRGVILAGPDDGSAGQVSRRRFGQAIVLLGWGLRGVEEAVKSGEAERDLALARVELADVRQDDAQLRRAWASRLPGVGAVPVHPGNAPRREVIVARMIEYAHAHYARPFTLAELAREQGMNASYLSTLFTSVTGIGFHTYLDDYRMKRARCLLQDPTIPVGEVAARVGFSSAHYFRQAFRRHTGRSPSAWRSGGDG